MYLTKLYRYNKWLFLAIVFFAVMQLLVTYKRGMVISPWYNYGMYSEKIYPKKVYEINNHLAGSNWFYVISPQHDDKINLTLDNYRNLSQNDSLYHKEIIRLFAKFHLPAPIEKFYNSQFAQEDFEAWFANYSGESNTSASMKTNKTIQPQQAIWNGKELILP